MQSSQQTIQEKFQAQLNKLRPMLEVLNIQFKSITSIEGYELIFQRDEKDEEQISLWVRQIDRNIKTLEPAVNCKMLLDELDKELKEDHPILRLKLNEYNERFIECCGKEKFGELPGLKQEISEFIKYKPLLNACNAELKRLSDETQKIPNAGQIHVKYQKAFQELCELGDFAQVEQLTLSISRVCAAIDTAKQKPKTMQNVLQKAYHAALLTNARLSIQTLEHQINIYCQEDKDRPHEYRTNILNPSVELLNDMFSQGKFQEMGDISTAVFQAAKAIRAPHVKKDETAAWKAYATSVSDVKSDSKSVKRWKHRAYIALGFVALGFAFATLGVTFGASFPVLLAWGLSWGILGQLGIGGGIIKEITARREFKQQTRHVALLGELSTFASKHSPTHQAPTHQAPTHQAPKQAIQDKRSTQQGSLSTTDEDNRAIDMREKERASYNKSSPKASQ